MSNQPQVCPVCGVKILKLIGGDRVLFSTGAPGTRASLWAKVCKFTDKPGCINRDPETIGAPNPEDYHPSDRR